MKKLILLLVVLVLFLMQSKSLFAQKGTSHSGAIKAGTHKIVPKSGIWFGKFEGEMPFWFEVKNGVLPGPAGISYVVTCGGFSESHTDYSVDLSKVGGRSGHMKTLSMLRYTDPNSFIAILSSVHRDDNAKITIILKGSFTSADSASGTVSARVLIGGNSLCDKPTVSSWTATSPKYKNKK